MATFAVIPPATDDQTVDSLLVPLSKGKMEFHHEGDQEDLLEELSEEQIASLLEEASTRLRQRAATSGAPELDTLLLQPDTIRLILFHLLFPIVFYSIMGTNASILTVFPNLIPALFRNPTSRPPALYVVLHQLPLVQPTYQSMTQLQSLEQSNRLLRVPPLASSGSTCHLPLPIHKRSGTFS